jgi:uncharacterized protein (TIGR03435 family)
LPGGGVTITNQPLRDVIRTTYGSDDIDVIGGPRWIDADRWDIVAAAPPGDPDAPWETMLRWLLAEDSGSGHMSSYARSLSSPS